jgi:CubicO group peptidase (beta-lactamase class C family)
MKTKGFLFPLLLVCAMLAVTVRRFAKRAPANPLSKSGSYDAIDAYVEGQMHRLQIPGVSLAIVQGDQIVHLRGFGRARPGGKAPSPQTPFVLGSTTKSFTALAVMQLVEAGKIVLDAPVQRYLPWFRVADPEASAQMTVRHLLNQTSGLPVFEGTIILADLDASPGAAERQARALSTLKLTRPVGAAFEYSNLNYNLLGLIIEAASGETYADYIQNHIFTPLEMSHSYTSQAEARKNGLAVGHRYWFAHPFAAPNLPMPRGSLAAGQLISCSEDMAHYLMAHLNGGRYKDVQILSPAGIDQLHHAGVEFREMGASSGYGMGWFVENVGPVEVVWHSGNVPDFSSYMAIIPEQRKGVVFLLNSDHYGLPFVLMEVGLRVAGLVAGQEPAPIRLGLIPWAMRALLLIPLIQIAGVAATLRLLRGWLRDPQSNPTRGRMWTQHILLPLVPNLSLAALPIFLKRTRILSYLRLFNPDIFWTALVCGGLSGIWTFLRTGLILRTLRER